MKIAYGSDLHTEFWRDEPPPKLPECDVLILAGDIGKKATAPAWARAAYPDVPILYVPGNHEFYGTQMSQNQDDIEKACFDAKVTRLAAFQPVRFGDKKFLGDTLWTDYKLHGNMPIAMADARGGLNDHRLIAWEKQPLERFLPKHAAQLHKYQRQQILDMLDAETVVVTHHAPSARSVNPKYEGDYLNPAFASEILGADGVDAPLWIHGHMHDAVDYTVGKTRVVCNPRGYPGEVYRTGEYQFKVVDI